MILLVMILLLLHMSMAAIQVFSTTLDSHDSYGWKTDSMWPPSLGGFTESSGATSLIVGCTFSSPDYFQDMSFMRFNTTALPDSISVSASRLIVHVSILLDLDAKYSIVGDSYDFGGSPATNVDWGIISAQASVLVPTRLSSILVGQDQSIALRDFSGINPTGWTGLRVSIDINNTAPTQDNVMFFASSDHATDVAPKLEVTYTIVPTTTSPSMSPTIASPSSSPTIVPSTSPSSSPTIVPSTSPSSSPTIVPSTSPSSSPTIVPSTSPSSSPTIVRPSLAPTTVFVTLAPSSSPTTSGPTISNSTIPNPTSSPSVGGCSLSGISGIGCSMGQNVIVGNVVVTQVTSIFVQGLIIVGNSSLRVPLGDVTISGILQIDLTEKPDGPIVLNVVEGSSVNGEFSAVNVTAPGLLDCESIDKTVSYAQSTVSVSLSVDSTGCTPSTSPGVYVGVAVGVILLGIGVGVAIALYRKRKMNIFMIEANEQILLRQVDDLERQKTQNMLDYNNRADAN